jgi:Domain of unknown function DUF1829/Domain of unknown function DUF1828
VTAVNHRSVGVESSGTVDNNASVRARSRLRHSAQQLEPDRFADDTVRVHYKSFGLASQGFRAAGSNAVDPDGGIDHADHNLRSSRKRSIGGRSMLHFPALSDLESSGLDVSTEKRKAHLQEILNGVGVAAQGEELFVRTTEKDFPQRKHNLLQAMLAVHDLYLTAQTHVQQSFTEDVALFLKTNDVPFFRDFKLSGRSGFDHHFDFAFPTTKEKPQRILVAINALSRDRATSTALAVSDVRLARGPETLQAFALINDQESALTSDYLDALRNYQITALRWTKRDEALVAFQS